MYKCKDCNTEAKARLWNGGCYWCGSGNVEFIKEGNINVLYNPLTEDLIRSDSNENK